MIKSVYNKCENTVKQNYKLIYNGASVIAIKIKLRVCVMLVKSMNGNF